MSLKAKFVGASSICLGLLSLTAMVGAQTTTGYLYATDYGNYQLNSGTQNLLRYSFTYNGTTGALLSAPVADGIAGTPGNANFITGLEAMAGTQDSILTATSTGINRYGLGGNLIGTINVLNANNSAHTFSGLAGMAISADGKFVYAAEETAGVVDKIDMKTGKITATYTLAGAHDVAIAPDGNLYVAAYSAKTGIFLVNPNTMVQTSHIVAAGTGTAQIDAATGMSFTGTATAYTLYANRNLQSANTGSVYAFNITNTNGTTSGTVALKNPTGNTNDPQYTPGNLSFDFGSAIGPDGNLYIAALGDGSGTSMIAQDGVYQFNLNTINGGTLHASTLYVAGYDQTSGTFHLPVSTPNSGVLVAPKYITFNTDFVHALDPGVPEPGALACLVSLSAVGLNEIRRRKKRQ